MGIIPVDDIMVARMAESVSMMDQDEKAAWSREAAAAWVQDEIRYTEECGVPPLPFDVEDVYDTIRAMIAEEEN